MSDELYEKTEALLKGLLSVKTKPGKNNSEIPAAVKGPTIAAPKLPSKLPDLSLKAPTMPKPTEAKLPKSPEQAAKENKIPGGLPPASKKDPKKMAEQLKNPNPKKLTDPQEEVLKVDSNGQWSLSKGPSYKDKAMRTFNSRWDQPRDFAEPHLFTSLPSKQVSNIKQKDAQRAAEAKWLTKPVNDDFEKGELDPNAGYKFTHEHHDLGNGNMLTRVNVHGPDGEHVGAATFAHQGGNLVPGTVAVDEAHQRKGIASAMYAHAEQHTGKKLIPSPNQTPEGAALWAGNKTKTQFG